ncbi:hypothetical protein JC796_17550 [Delftia acidovorans]|nr:hypothetical protein [Delftia acidovorans]MBJ2142551.1 hypothetical protein [Delftia acidovorans]
MSDTEFYLLAMMVLSSPRMNEWVRNGMFFFFFGTYLWKTYGGQLG